MARYALVALCAAVVGLLTSACESEAEKTGGSGGGSAGTGGALACTPGESCGSDCMPQDSPCWNCGTLTWDSECHCQVDINNCAEVPDCSAPGPVGEGEYCGEYWWCDRDCLPGLVCELKPAEDAGPGGSYVKTCQQP